MIVIILAVLVIFEVVVQFGSAIGLGGSESAIISVVAALIILLVHGWNALGWRHLVAYLIIAVVISFTAEALGVATGLVFGPYHYTDLFGPKLLGVPPLIQAAYAAMGYASLTIARLILRMRGAPKGLGSVLGLALLGAMIMVAWDVAMDPYQSTVSGIWIWHTGGPYFGVGFHNFVGWFGTVFCYLLVYCFYASRNPEQPNTSVVESRLFWSMPVFLYAAFGLGNITPVWTGLQQPYASANNYNGSPQTLSQSLALVTIYVMGIPVVASLLNLWRGDEAT
jgi:putative membrane protein